jgi:hypothetical protein
MPMHSTIIQRALSLIKPKLKFKNRRSKSSKPSKNFDLPKHAPRSISSTSLLSTFEASEKDESLSFIDYIVSVCSLHVACEGIRSKVTNKDHLGAEKNYLLPELFHCRR